MAAEIVFIAGSKEFYPEVGVAAVRLCDIGRFEDVHLRGNPLHLLRGKPLGACCDQSRIAAERGGGENIYPREIEEVLYSHPAVELATVIGVRDKIYGELPKAFIVLKEGKSVTTEEILKFCKENLADFKVPKYVEFREVLLMTPTGKIMKQALRDEEKAQRD